MASASTDPKLPLPVGPGELAHLTRSDPSLEHARQAASTPQNDSYMGPQFEWTRSLFYKVVKDKRQLVLPASLHQRLLFLTHEEPLAGHQAVDKTLAQLTQKFYWPGIWAQVTQHCEACPECQLVQPKWPKGGMLQAMPIV